MEAGLFEAVGEVVGVAEVERPAGTPAKKLNINKASSCELQTTLAITADQAQAIIAYRAKNGDFKDLDGVKKVDGIDVAAITAKKDNITF